MNSFRRRDFLQRVGQTTLVASIGSGLALELGIASDLHADEPKKRLHFGKYQALADLLQESSIDQLQARLVKLLATDTSLKDLVCAAALANARTFGGEDYVGFHTFMALGPAWRMSQMMPTKLAPLPVLKVLYRNTKRIGEFGGITAEVLHQLDSDHAPSSGGDLRDALLKKDTNRAEAMFSSIVKNGAEPALDALLPFVHENPEVHRTVLPYRAFEMLSLVGQEQAETLLRQSLRYCLKAESQRRPTWSEPSNLLTKLFDEYKLLDRPLGTKSADDAFVEKLANTFSSGTPTDAARAAAEALRDGIDPKAIGEAISLAATQLVLRDPGRIPQWEDRLKPAGSVHGDSMGVHASDAANAWRNMALACHGRSKLACLLVGAWEVARDRTSQRLLDEPLPATHHVNRITGTTQDELIKQLHEAITNNLQGQASAIAHVYGKKNLPAEPIFKALLQYAVSEDGALHAEKYFQTVWDDFHFTRESLRWQHVASLARVTASEFGKPAAGQEEARQLLAGKTLSARG